MPVDRFAPVRQADQFYRNPDPMAPRPDATLPYIDGTARGEPMNDPGAMIQALLRDLLQPTPEPPPKVRVGQGIVGAIGDALLAASQARAGGVPSGLGPFGMRMRERENQYRETAAETAKYNRDVTGRLRIGQFEGEQARQHDIEMEKLRAKREKENAQTRAENMRPITSKGVENVNGVNLNYIQFYNPVTKEPFRRIYEGEKGYSDFIVQSSEGTVRVPRSGKGAPSTVTGPSGGPLRPPASEETQQRLGNIAGFRQGIGRLKETLPSLISGSGGPGRVAQQVVRRLPMVGPQVSERMSAGGEQVAAVRDRVMADFIRIMSGLQASEAEQARLARILPDLGTVDAQTALAKIAEFEQGVIAYVRERARLRPDLFTPDDLKSLGLGSATTDIDWNAEWEKAGGD